VHLCDFPVAEEGMINEDLNRQMGALLEAVGLGRACRAAANIKVRQPLEALYVKGTVFDPALAELAKDELNVKRVVFTNDARAFTTYRLKPQMRTLGPKYGKLLGAIGGALKEMDGNDVVDAFAEGRQIRFAVQGAEVALDKDDVLTEATQKPGFSAQTERELTVVLDCNLTPELIREGYWREVVSKLQTMRKEANFEVSDGIRVTYEADAELSAAIEEGGAFISRSVLAVSLQKGAGSAAALSREWDINGKTAALSVEKAE
jgi:isoleucyl-tRNA synthetase